jgi:hypothetical protein
MPHLAITRAGVQSFIASQASGSSLWIGSNVLSEAEISLLRAAGPDVTVFIHPVQTVAEVEDAVPTLREHHPNDAVWIEAPPEHPNPRSDDIGQAFMWHEFVISVRFRHKSRVRVMGGQHAGSTGNLVSLIALEPEALYILEADSGEDIEVAQSLLASEA